MLVVTTTLTEHTPAEKITHPAPGRHRGTANNMGLTKQEKKAMRSRWWFAICAIVLPTLGLGLSYVADPSGAAMSRAAHEFLGKLSPEQRAKTQLEFETRERFAWHFVPLDQRKGLQIKDMTDTQRQAVHDLLKSCAQRSRLRKSDKDYGAGGDPAGAGKIPGQGSDP